MKYLVCILLAVCVGCSSPPKPPEPKGDWKPIINNNYVVGGVTE